LRGALLDFIADFANWDNSTVREYLDSSTFSKTPRPPHYMLRQRIYRLGLYGWQRFPETYRQAPGSNVKYANDKLVFTIEQRWAHLFA
jgi:hypothetical protein